MGNPRRTYQQRVGTLLKAIEERYSRQLLLAARGVTSMGMRDLEQEIQGLRNELAAVIAAGSDALVPNEAPREQPTRGFEDNRGRRRVSRPVSPRQAATAHFAAHS